VRSRELAVVLLIFAITLPVVHCDLGDDASSALQEAVRYYRTVLSCRGGYLGEYSEDLDVWIGEGTEAPYKIWIQPPGTPSIGQTFLRAYSVTGDLRYLEAARAVADSLIWGQLVSGGWEYTVDFLGEGVWRYRHEKVDDPLDRNQCTFDDDVSQSATRFLMAIDSLLDADPYTDAALYALDFFMESQFPNGAWPQRYPLSDDYPDNYADYYTFNDQVINDCIDLMLEAYSIYGDERYLDSAERGGHFIMLSQINEPQAGWAQQYYWNLTPAWARSFEPPMVCSRVTRENIISLLELYLVTGNETYLEPIPAAIDWLNNSTIAENRWARFYELGANLPIYCDRDRKLTYNLSDLSEERRTGYGWQGSYGAAGISMYQEVMSKGREGYLAERNRELTPEERLQKAAGLEAKVRGAIDSLDDKGRWVEDGYIFSRTFNTNAGNLISYLDYSGYTPGQLVVPHFADPKFAATMESIKIEMGVRSTGPDGIEEVTMRLTPPTSTEVHAFVDDGTSGDREADDGIYTLVYPTDQQTSLPVYWGMVVAEDGEGEWNLTLLPLGLISRIASGLAGIRSAIEEAAGLGVDLSSLSGELAMLEGGFGQTTDYEGLEAILGSVEELETLVQIRTVAGLIEIVSDLIDSAKNMGIDTSRHEIYLRRAREEFEKGNYGPARQFTNYPLRLREEVSEPLLVLVLSLSAVLLHRELT
jgi:PelA/Pel-15E family pectate lyase